MTIFPAEVAATKNSDKILRFLVILPINFFLVCALYFKKSAMIKKEAKR